MSQCSSQQAIKNRKFKFIGSLPNLMIFLQSGALSEPLNEVLALCLETPPCFRTGWGTNQTNSKENPLLLLESWWDFDKSHVFLFRLLGEEALCLLDLKWVTMHHWTTDIKGFSSQVLQSGTFQRTVHGYICKDPWIPY